MRQTGPRCIFVITAVLLTSGASARKSNKNEKRTEHWSAFWKGNFTRTNLKLSSGDTRDANPLYNLSGRWKTFMREDYYLVREAVLNHSLQWVYILYCFTCSNSFCTTLVFQVLICCFLCPSQCESDGCSSKHVEVFFISVLETKYCSQDVHCKLQLRIPAWAILQPRTNGDCCRTAILCHNEHILRPPE